MKVKRVETMKKADWISITDYSISEDTFIKINEELSSFNQTIKNELLAEKKDAWNNVLNQNATANSQDYLKLFISTLK